MLDNHPVYHPRPSLGSNPQAKARGNENEGAKQAYTDLHIPNQKAKFFVYNMERFAKECVTVFCDLTDYDIKKVGTAPTPFIDESQDTLVRTQPLIEAVAKAAPTGEASTIACTC